MILLAAFGLALCQTPSPPANAQPPGFFGSALNQVEEILTGASPVCNDSLINNPYIEGVFCGGLIPPSFLQTLSNLVGVNISFTPAGPACAALACAYRLMGCAAPTYRVEAQIIAATGMHEMDCGSLVSDGFLDADTCTALISHIGGATMKRSVAERVVLDEKPLSETEEAMMAARAAIELVAPDLYKTIDWTGVPDHKKRQSSGGGLQLVLSQLQLCSPLISIGIGALVGVTGLQLPINITSLLGPCGLVCNYAVCGANLLCANQAGALLASVNAQRQLSGCAQLTCSSFIIAPANQCGSITCNNAAGQYNPGHFSSTVNCLAPSVINIATKTAPTAAACCETCTNPCANVACTTTIQQCPIGTWPFCYDAVLAKLNPLDCCAGCVDPCFSFNYANNQSIAMGKPSMCTPTPNTCASGQVYGPGYPGSCCPECTMPCAGVTCANQPTSQANCPANTHFVAKVSPPTQCSHCCNQCAAGAPPTPPAMGVVGGASANVIAVLAMLFALLVAVF